MTAATRIDGMLESFRDHQIGRSPIRQNHPETQTPPPREWTLPPKSRCFLHQKADQMFRLKRRLDRRVVASPVGFDSFTSRRPTRNTYLLATPGTDESDVALVAYSKAVNVVAFKRQQGVPISDIVNGAKGDGSLTGLSKLFLIGKAPRHAV